MTVAFKKHHSESAANKISTYLNVDSVVSTIFANKVASFPPGLLLYKVSATHTCVERWSSLVSDIRSHLRFAKWMSYLSLFFPEELGLLSICSVYADNIEFSIKHNCPGRFH